MSRSKSDASSSRNHTEVGPVATKTELLARLREIEDSLRSLGIRRLAVFGSFARGDHDQTSDVDVFVEFEPGTKNFDQFMQAAFLLEDSLQRRVELVTAEALSPYIGPHILSELEDVLLAA